MKSLKDFYYLLSLDRRYTKTESEIFRFKRQLPQGAAERGFSPQHPNEKSHDSNIGILALYLWEDLII